MPQFFATQSLTLSDVDRMALPGDDERLGLTDVLLGMSDDSAPGGLPMDGAGDDTVDVTASTTGYGTLDGGAGTDTLRLNPASPQTIANGPFGSYALSIGVFNVATTLTSFERFVFNSTAGNTMSAQFAYGGNNNALNQIGPGLAANSEIVGGAGNDTITLIYASANQPGTVTAPSFTFTNWTTPTRAYLPGDRVSVSVSGSGATTIYGTAHSGVQGLIGGSGNDIIYGSDDMDSISGGAAGADQLHGGGGDDTFTLTNTYTVSSTGTVGAESTRTGAGTLFDGGAGTDFLLLGGTVNFQGTLQSIEGLYLQPAYFNSNNPAQPILLGSQYATSAFFSNATFGTLPGNLIVDGQGVINIATSDAGETFDGSGFVFDSNALVAFTVHGGDGNDHFTGTSSSDDLEGDLGDDTLAGGGGDDLLSGGQGNDGLTGGAGNDTLYGEEGNDTIDGGADNDTLVGFFGDDVLTGGTGADTFDPGLGTDVITDFTHGVDTIDLSTMGITSFAQFTSRAAQVGADVVFTISIDEFTFSTLTLKNVMLAQLGAADFVFASTVDTSIIGSEHDDDLLYGIGDSSTTYGLDGDDLIVTGPGTSRWVQAGTGNDTVILSDHLTRGGLYGDTNFFTPNEGYDTLVLRPRGASSVVGSTYNFTDFNDYTAANYIEINGFNRIILESAANTVFNVILRNFESSTLLAGGAGSDIVTIPVYSSVPSFALINWGADDKIVFLGSATYPTMIATRTHPGLFQFIGSTADDTITAGTSRDQLEGGDGNDTLNGGGGTDTLLGGAGNDHLIVGAGGNGTIVDGGADSDTLVVTGSVSLGGLSGIEAVELQSGANLTLTGDQFATGLALGTVLSGTGTITVNMSPDQFLLGSTLSVAGGSSIAVVFNGSSGNDYVKAVTQATNTMLGGDGNDFLRGGQLADRIDGGTGGDKIAGFGGADTLTGGDGPDQFRYLTQNDSGLGAAADHITDFTIGSDRLNFQLFDGDSNTPDVQNPGFSFLGNQAFHATGAAEIRYEDAGNDMVVQVDVNGDGVADMAIYLDGLHGMTLTGADFML